MKSLCNSSEIPESHEVLQDRFKKAIGNFSEQTKSKIETSFKSFGFTTDNKALEKDINKQLDTLEELLATKLLYFESLKNGFNVKEFLELRGKAVFLAKEKPKKQRKAIIENTSNVELFEILRVLRNEIAIENDLIHYQVFNQKSLYAMCELLPTNKIELKQIHGMGKTRIEKYGSEILEVIKKYLDENDFKKPDELRVIEISKPKQKKDSSKKISLELFRSGKTIEDIADERVLNPNTIFGHLASFVVSGEVKVTDLMS